MTRLPSKAFLLSFALVAVLLAFAFVSPWMADAEADDAVGAWEFDEADGAVVDVSGSGNDGVLEKGAAREAGTIGGGVLVFDDADDRVAVNTVSEDALDATRFTLAAWIKPTGNAGIIFRKGNTEVARFGFGIDNGGELFLRSGHATEGQWKTEGAVPLNEWLHVAVAYDFSGQPVFYVNGVAVPSAELQAPSGDIVEDTPYIYIGSNHDFANNAEEGLTSAFGGRMDSVRFYDRGLSAFEIASLASSGPGGATGIGAPQKPLFWYLCPNIARPLSQGSRGEDVILLQGYLVGKDYLDPKSITGYFGPATEAAVHAFQKDKGIASEGAPGYGIVGPKTSAAIYTPCERK